MREKGQTEVAKTLETPVFSRGIEILTEKCQLVLENETLRKYTILVMLYKFERALVYQLAVKDLPELKCAAGSKPYEDENEIR